MNRLVRYAWPGNVRELENVVERAIILLMGEHISERELPERLLTTPQVESIADAFSMDTLTLEDVEHVVIRETLKRFDGNKTEAAKVLGITRKTLHAKLQKYGGVARDEAEEK